MQNLESKKPRRTHRKLRLALLLCLIVIIVVGLLAIAYYDILPTQEDTHYINGVTPAYNQQRGQMMLAYKSYSRPVFTSNDTTPASDAQDLAYINSVIKKADVATSALSAKDNLNVLPGTQGFKAVKNTDAQYLAMQQYVNDSKTFLANYQDASTYVSRLEHIENSVQLTAFFSSLNNIKQATTAAQLSSAATSASTDLSSSITALNALNPPPDFQQISASLVTKLNDVNNDFIDIINGVPGEDAEQVTNSVNLLEQIAATLHGFSNTNVAGMLPAHSLLYEDILKLQGEHPLDSSKP